MNTSPSLFIDPPSHHFLGDRLFESGLARYNGDNLLAPYIHLRDWFACRGVDVHTADLLETRTGGRAIYVSMGMLDRYRALAARREVILSAFFALECPIVEPRMYAELPRAQRSFRRIFSWTDGDTLRRFTGRTVRVLPFRWPQSFDAVHEGLWRRGDRAFLVMMNANKLPRVYWQELYTERMRAVEFFARTGEIDLYGQGWDGPSMRLGRTRVPWTLKRWYLDGRRVVDRYRPDPLLVAARKVWRGPAESKSETLSGYRFALCFENAAIKGWITEKIFDCFFAGTVPIYRGAPDIADSVPTDAFIDMRRFAGYDELRRYLHGLGPDAVNRYREAGREFVASQGFAQFSKQAFTECFASILRQDAGWGAPAAPPVRHDRAREREGTPW
jgi:hypothetical protein